MQDLKVGLIQSIQYWEDKTANLKHFEKLISKNFNKSLDLILLPEMFNTSFTMNTVTNAEEMSGETVNWMKSQASNYDCQIAGSVIIKDGVDFYNRFLVVSSRGVVNQYDKRHLFRMAKENEHYTAGEERVIHEIKGWKILLQVCYDLRFPVFSRNKRVGDKKEYDMAIYVANWPEKRTEIWKTLLRARAIENQCFCIGLNRIGKDANQISYSGDSLVIDPWGNFQVKFASHKEIVKIVTLKSELLDDITLRFPAYLDAD